VKIIADIADTLVTKENLYRVQVNINQNFYDVASIERIKMVWNLVEVIDGLYHMACNDSIKYDIYVANQMNLHLRKLIYHGNEVKLLWQLCFEARIAEDIRKDNKLLDKIKELEKGYFLKTENLTMQNK